MRRSLITAGFALVASSLAGSVSAQDSIGLGDGSDGTLHIADGFRPTIVYVPLESGTGAMLRAAEPPAGFSPGDAVVVWQSGFDADALADAGPLLGRVFLTRIGGMSGNEIVLTESPGWDVRRGAQLVRVIEAQDFIVDSGEDWYIDHFFGTKHGMLVVFARGDVTIDGDIIARGAGYERGESALSAEARECGMPLTVADTAGRGGGGAIFFTPSRCGALYGCGSDPFGLGGGAAPAFGMGGGGGGNAGRGGSAYHSTGCMPAARLAGGAPAGPGGDDVVYLGGGGGAAAFIDGGGSLAGGDGGGVIFIRGANITGGGGLIADGDPGDGGGGGAGGTVVVQSAGELTLCSIYARGGAAGDLSGAGGGGRIVAYGADTGCFGDDLVAGGNPSMAGGIAERGRVERMPELSCSRCPAGLLCDPISYACARCSTDGECDAFGPSFACAGDGTCYDACAGLCAADERCVPDPAGGYECASTNGCTVDGDCRLGLCDVAMSVCVPGACRLTSECASGSRCDPDPAHPGLGNCVRDIVPMPPGTPPPSGQFRFLGGGGCSAADPGADALAWSALALLALRSIRRRRR
jgi:MYXO-CTERM domain-containing protein